MFRKNSFKHLHEDQNVEEKTGASLSAKRVTLLIFVAFLLLFPHYAPWEPSYQKSDSLLQMIFTLYFFVA
ncbi:MAG: hypothetical protein EP216_02460, partial [Epsilonproteobacteria bacterium]